MGKSKKEINVIWFKRDLRLEDHEAIIMALQEKRPLLFLYVYEPEIWKNNHYSERHINFIKESISDINQTLMNYDTEVYCPIADVITVIKKIQTSYTIEGIYSSEETGIDITFQRDIQFAKFCLRENINWFEFQNNGVQRAIKNRKRWSNDWYRYMKKPIQQIDLRKANFLSFNAINFLKKDIEILRLSTAKHQFQLGGRTEGKIWENSFFEERLPYYSDYISKPEKSRYGCSRLSPYISWGCLSIRELYQRSIALKEESPYKRQLMAFRSRLRWQSHFIQKFESEPRMEFEAINKAFLTVDQPEDDEKIKAWKVGKTGYPLVDASVRCVVETGYINFRMRSMITSFFTHHLFQHFSHMSEWLAQQFLDFEPGIHYGQIQMQSGFTGTNTVRVYNPTKNAIDHDPEAIFIKKWVPELRMLPAELAVEPWKITALEENQYQFYYGTSYVKRIVDIVETRKKALKILYGQRKSELAKEEKSRILELHTIPRRN